MRASAASLLAEEPDSLAVDESDSGKNIHGSAPSESALIELETGAAALAMATAAGEAAMKAVLGESGATRSRED